jgi:hypothetical protein
VPEGPNTSRVCFDNGRWTVEFFWLNDGPNGYATGSPSEYFMGLTRTFDTREEAEAYGADTVAANDSMRRLQRSAPSPPLKDFLNPELKKSVEEFFQKEFTRRAAEETLWPEIIYRGSTK